MRQYALVWGLGRKLSTLLVHSRWVVHILIGDSGRGVPLLTGRDALEMGAGPPLPPLQYAQDMPSWCLPDGKCRTQLHL